MKKMAEKLKLGSRMKKNPPEKKKYREPTESDRVQILKLKAKGVKAMEVKKSYFPDLNLNNIRLIMGLEPAGRRTLPKSIDNKKLTFLFIKAINKRKKELVEEAEDKGIEPTFRNLMKLKSMKQIMASTQIETEKELGAGKALSIDTLQRRYKQIREDEDLLDLMKRKVILTKAELTDIMADPLVTHVMKLKKWKASKRYKKKVMTALRDIQNFVKRKYNKHKFITDWTEEDVDEALEFIDEQMLKGTYPARTGLNVIFKYKPHDVQFLHIDTVKAEHEVSSAVIDAGMLRKQSEHPELYEVLKKYGLDQVRAIKKKKKTPKPEQVKQMYDLIKNLKVSGKYTYTTAEGKKKRISKDIEKMMIEVTIDIACDTGMRSGSAGLGTGIQSLTWEDFKPYEEKQLEVLEKLQAKRKEQKLTVRINPLIVKKLEILRELLKPAKDEKIIPIPMSKINSYLRDLAEEAKIIEYDYIWGIPTKIPEYPHSNKVRFIECPQNEKTAIDPYSGTVKKCKKYKRKDIFGHYIRRMPKELIGTADPIDLHLHLFRAYHVRQLKDLGLPLELAIQSGVGWKSIQVVIDHYLGDISSKEQKQIDEVSEKAFIALNPDSLSSFEKKIKAIATE